MGLTIHYQLSTQSDWTEEEVFARWEIIGDYARHLGCDNVGDVLPAHKRQDVTDKLHRIGRGLDVRWVAIHARVGWILPIEIGKGCEPFMLALCRYPGRWQCQHGHSMKRWHPTKISADWQFSWFCKTQFAGQFGLAHFLRCHKTVISLLDFCRKAGLDVTVQDESDFWEDRNEQRLIKSIQQNEALMAAFGGLIKDTVEKKRGHKVHSPIFDYHNFEHLEHEGRRRFGKMFTALMDVDLRNEI